MAREIVIYTDESDKHGRHFGNFYGALIVESAQLQVVDGALAQRKSLLGLTGEIKWTNVTPSVVDRYADFVEALFDHVVAGRVKIRVMFTQSRHIPMKLTAAHREQAFHILYYQFVRHGLGLRFAGTSQATGIRLNMDQLPDTSELNQRFKGFLLGLNHSTEFRSARLFLRPDQMAEVRSHEHILLQALDLVLGSVAFRLNDKHLDRPDGDQKRGRRTLAKERLYRFILRQIRRTRSNFNIGLTTGLDGDLANRWRQPYRHWLFIPREHAIDRSKGKRKKKAP